MIKVLHFFKTSLPSTMGGVEQVIDQLCRGTKQYNIDSSVLALTNSSVFRPYSEYNGYKLHLVKSDLKIAATDFSLSAFHKFSQLAKQVDIIHYHFPWPFMDLVHFATRIKKPTLITYHSDIVRQKNLMVLYKPLMNAFLNDVDRIIVTSPNYLESSEVLKKFENKTTIIPIGIAKSSYPLPNLERISYWKNLFRSDFFLFIGVLRYYKGIHVLLEASVDTEIPVVIVGNGPLREKLECEAKRLGLKNVYFVGAIPDEDKVALLYLCFGIVFPSHLRSEAFGISLLEGAMYGKPMISCEIGTGTSFINKNNITGLVIPPDNSVALKNAMFELWSNPLSAKQLGMNAEEHFNRNFTSDEMNENYSKIYHTLYRK